MDLASFLVNVMPTKQEGFFELCLRANNNSWHQFFYDWPDQRASIVAEALERRAEYDVFFSPVLYKDRCSQRVCVLPTDVLFCDVDEGKIDRAPVPPSILVRTSANRHQAGWKIKDPPEDLEYIEQLSRKITYSVDGADRSGWNLGHKMRLPDTYNHKYLEGPQLVEVVDSTLKVYTCEEVELLSDADTVTLTRFDPEFLSHPPTEYPKGPNILLDSIKDQIPPRVIAEYNITSRDRSASLWLLMCSCFRAGLDRNAVFWIAKHSANNKFDKLKYHGERELAKDVLRAEQAVLTKRANARETIHDLKKLKLHRVDKNETVFGVVKDLMLQNGSFVMTRGAEQFYVPRESGRPIPVSNHSRLLDSLLDIQYGLNPVEPEHAYVTHGLINYSVSLHPSAITGSLSHFDLNSRTVLLHSGSKDVYVINAQGVEVSTDGSYGVIFPWQNTFEHFSYNKKLDKDWDWSEEGFGDLKSLIDLTPQEGRCILRTWMLFMFLRSASLSRPILAFFGQPGAGKSTTMNRINKIIYGSRMGLNTVTSSFDFDNLVTSNPFVAFDGVDSFAGWLPDKLSTSAAVTDYGKRALFTNNESLRFTRQALIGITAHNPRFMREDIADRLLLFNFQRLDSFAAETPIYNRLLAQRSNIMTAIMNDLVKVVATEPLPFTDLRFRIEDFARMGEQISIALGYREMFRSILTKMSQIAVDTTLEADGVLLQALDIYINKEAPDDFIAPAKLFEKLLIYCPPSEVNTYRAKYKNASVLSRKLWTLQSSLRSTYEVAWRIDRGVKEWKIQKKPY